MAITKKTEVDKIEVVGPFNHVQVRTATIIEEDGVEVARTIHRHVICPGDDVSAEDAKVKAIAATVHTPEVIAEFAARGDR